MWVVASKTRVRHKRNRNISRNLVGAEEEKEGVAVAYHGPRPEEEAEAEAVAGAALISNN